MCEIDEQFPLFSLSIDLMLTYFNMHLFRMVVVFRKTLLVSETRLERYKSD